MKPFTKYAKISATGSALSMATYPNVSAISTLTLPSESLRHEFPRISLLKKSSIGEILPNPSKSVGPSGGDRHGLCREAAD